MPGPRRALPFGVVPPEAALLIAREYPEMLRLLQARARDLKAGGGPRVGAALEVFVSTTLDSAEARAEVLSQACSGSAEVPQSVEQAVSCSPSGVAQWVTTQKAAEVLEVSDRQVRNLLNGGRLVRLPGRGPHRIATWSLEAELERRGAENDRSRPHVG